MPEAAGTGRPTAIISLRLFTATPLEYLIAIYIGLLSAFKMAAAEYARTI
jgi:hypothetical protein